jgi:hypothetical protein
LVNFTQLDKTGMPLREFSAPLHGIQLFARIDHDLTRRGRISRTQC